VNSVKFIASELPGKWQKNATTEVVKGKAEATQKAIPLWIGGSR
jgi:hypothetical protein